MSSGPGDPSYPDHADEVWIAGVVRESVKAIEQELRVRGIRFPAGAQLQEQKAFLRKAVRGFVVEALRQARDETPPLNDVVLVWTADERMRKEAASGIYHAAACLKWLREALPAQPDDKHESILGITIRNTLYCFNNRFSSLPEARPFSHASIRHDIKKIRRLADGAQAIAAEKPAKTIS